jgi:hypothetical protein
MPKLWTLVHLPQWYQDMYGVGRYSESGTLIRMVEAALRVDPFHALGAFPTSIDTSGGWVLRVLELPEKRGVVEYSLESYERIVVLYRVLWR